MVVRIVAQVGVNLIDQRSKRVSNGEHLVQLYRMVSPLNPSLSATELSAAIRTGPDAVLRLLEAAPELAHETTTGGASPLHVCGMSKRGELSTDLLVAAREWSSGQGVDSAIDGCDTWGYTALQRHATNNLAIGAKALIEAGASHTRPSGLEGEGESARQLARRLRSFAVLKVFQQYELASGIPLPDDEIEL